MAAGGRIAAASGSCAAELDSSCFCELSEVSAAASACVVAVSGCCATELGARVFELCEVSAAASAWTNRSRQASCTLLAAPRRAVMRSLNSLQSRSQGQCWPTLPWLR